MGKSTYPAVIEAEGMDLGHNFLCSSCFFDLLGTKDEMDQMEEFLLLSDCIVLSKSCLW